MLSRLVVVVLLAAGCLAIACGPDQTLRPDPDALTQAARPQATEPSKVTPVKLQLVSSAFTDNGPIPEKYTCNGEETSPPLTITGGPAGVKTFALIVTDIDANVVHWTLWNIDPSTREIAEGHAPPESLEGRNGLSSNGFVPPCPPSGVHHYVFDLYALDKFPGIARANGVAELLNAMKDHILEQAQLTGLYGRS